MGLLCAPFPEATSSMRCFTCIATPTKSLLTVFPCAPLSRSTNRHPIATLVTPMNGRLAVSLRATKEGSHADMCTRMSAHPMWLLRMAPTATGCLNSRPLRWLRASFLFPWVLLATKLPCPPSTLTRCMLTNPVANNTSLAETFSMTSKNASRWGIGMNHEMMLVKYARSTPARAPSALKGSNVRDSKIRRAYSVHGCCARPIVP
mmetsp:Transcript_19786/g.59785  ORF Transcript_19786/g.59785 Transcript_19786/m.59785 type:complete len:205 (+) Transcript_19786:1387-2001(+)